MINLCSLVVCVGNFGMGGCWVVGWLCVLLVCVLVSEWLCYFWCFGGRWLCWWFLYYVDGFVVCFVFFGEYVYDFVYCDVFFDGVDEYWYDVVVVVDCFVEFWECGIDCFVVVVVFYGFEVCELLVLYFVFDVE